jgi:hypothetical protein
MLGMEEHRQSAYDRNGILIQGFCLLMVMKGGVVNAAAIDIYQTLSHVF